MDLRSRNCIILSEFTNEEIRQNTRKKTKSSKTTKFIYKNKNKTPKRRGPRKTMPSRINKNIVEHSTHATKYHSSKAVIPSYVNKNKTAEDFAHISKQQNAKTATQCDANKNKTGEDSVHISKQQHSGKAISRCVIDGTSEDNILIAPKAILKRKKSDSLIETRQNSTKQDGNSCDNQMTSKRQRIKNDYFVKTDNNNAENIIVSPRKRKSDSEFETQSTSISNQSFEISLKKRRQETSVCDNTNISITNTKVTTAPKFSKNQNQLSCNQSTTLKNKRTEKETLNGDKTNVTIIDNSEILLNERVETCSEMQKNRSPFSKNLEMDNEDIYVLYDNFSTEDRNLNVQSRDINILNRSHERSTTYQSEINNASRKNSHDEIENSRKLLNSMPVYNINKRYFKTFTATYDNFLRKNSVFTIKNLCRMTHISELDLSSSFRYGNQFSSHLTNKIIRLPIDTHEYRFGTVCDLNESFLFNLIAAEDNDKLKFDNLQNIECAIYYNCKNNENLNSVNRTKTNFANRTKSNFAGRVILTSDTKHLIKYPADLKKYLLNKNKRDFPHLGRSSIDNDVGDTNRPSNEADVYFVLRGMIQGISKKYEKQKHVYTCKCCSTPFRTYNELEPICRSCNIYCTLDLQVKHFESKGFENSSITNPVNNTCLHLMSGSPVTDRQESQQKLLVENTDEGKDANTGAELIMLDTSEGCGEHGTCMVTEEIPQFFETLTEIEKIDMSGMIEGIIQALDAELENPDITVENDAMPEHLEGEVTDEKDGCEGQDDAILLKSTKTVQFENTVLPSLDAEPQGQDNDDSNIQFISLDDSNSGEISSTVEITVADDEQNLSKNNSVPSCTSRSIGSTSISEPDISEIQIIEHTSICQRFVIQYCQSSTDTSNLPLTASDVSKDLSQNSVVPTCFSNPNSPEIEIIDAIIKPLKSSSDTDNPKLHSPTIDEPQRNLSKKSPLPTPISRPDSPEIQIIDAIIKPIKSSSNTDNPKLHSAVIDEPEENLSKKSPMPRCISQTESPEIQVVEDTPVCLSSSDTSNPKLPSDTIDGTEKNFSENFSKPTGISRSDSSEIRSIECTSISQSMDMPNLLSTTTDVSADLFENSSLPTGMPNLLATTTDVSHDLSEISSLPTNISRCFALKFQIIEYNSVSQSSDAQDPKLLHESVLKLPIEVDSIEMPSNMDDNFVNNEGHLSENSLEPVCNSQYDCSKIQIVECKSLWQSDSKLFSNITEESGETFSENSQMTTRISQSVSPEIQILNYNSNCEAPRDSKLSTTDESVLKTPVIIYSGEMPSNVEDNSVNNEEHLSENSPDPICNSQHVVPKIPILEYNSLCQSDLKIFSNTTEESKENLSENSQMPTRISRPVSPKVQILECNSISKYSSVASKLPSTTSDESEENLSENSPVSNSISQSNFPKIQILESNSIFPSSSDIHSPQSPNPTATTDDSNVKIPVIQLVKNLTDTINSTHELLGNSAISDKIIFSRTLPASSVTDTSINSIEEGTLEEEVQRKASENANSTPERDFCDISDTKDHSESNLIPGRDNYINGCNSENSLRLSKEKESTEHGIEPNSKSHEFLNYSSSKNSTTKKAKKDDDDFTPTLPTVNVSPISSKEEVPLEEKVERENAENSNYTHERNVCELSDTKDHSESNITSDIASSMNECHSENTLQGTMDAGESTERDIPKSNSFSLEFLNSQNSNNLSLKTGKEGGVYTRTLPPANANESSISCTEEIPLEEVVQRKTAKNSNCAVERNFSGTKDHSESDFISDRDSYLNDCNSEKVSIDIEESATQIPDSNSLSDEFLNFRKAKKDDDDDYTRTLPTASVNDSPISSAKDVSVEEEVKRQTAENSNFSPETGSCDVSDTKDHSESNFISDRDSYLNDYNSENSLVIPEVNSMSHELLNSPNSNDLPLKKTQIYSDVSDCSVISTEELSLEEKMQRKNSENSNYTPERYFGDFSDVKNHISNLKQNTDNYKVTSSNFVCVDEDFPKVFFKYVRVFEDLLPQEIISGRRSNADGSENACLTLEMLGIASTIASLDILNDYSKVSKFIDFVSKCIYYLENHENRDELQILEIKYFLKKLYVINDFIEKYGTYDKLVEDLLKNGGKISVWDSNRDGTKEGNLVRYSNIDPKLRKEKSLLETKDDPSTKGTTSNMCDTLLELLNNPAFLEYVSHQTSSKHKNRYVKFCTVINCKACSIYSDRDGDKLEAIAKASEDYDESNAQMSSESKNSNSHESGTRLHNKGLRLEKCIKKIKNINEPLSSDVSNGSSKKQLISGFQGMSPTNKSNTLSSTSESDFHAALTSQSKTITYDSISPVHANYFSTNSKTVITFSESLVGADSSQLNNTSCLLDYSRVVEALTTEDNLEISQNRLSPKSLMNQVLKGKRPYRKRTDNTIKEKRKYRKRNVKPNQEQLPVSTSSISSLGQSINTPVVDFKAKENALANPPIPQCNQNPSLYMSQEQQPASANPSIPLCNQNPSLYIDQGQQYPHANLPVPLGNHGAICMDQRQSLNASQASGNMHYNYETNPHFDYRMSSYSSPSQVPWDTRLNFVSESRSSRGASRGEFSTYEKNIQNTRTFTGSRGVPYPPQYMPRYSETFSQRPPLHSSRTLSSTSQPSSQSMYPGHHSYPYQCYPSMPHCSSTMTQSTPIVPPSSYPQSSYSSSQSTPIIPSPSYPQSSYSSFQPSPSLQRIPYASPRMQRSSSDPRALPYLHQMNLPHTHHTYK